MSAFDFDLVPERRGTASYKWDTNAARFGRDDLIPMWVADMDFAAPQAVTDALIARAAHSIYGYTAHTEASYHAVTGWLERRHGWKVPRETLLFAPPGAIYAIHAAVAELTAPGDEVLVLGPGYKPLTEVVTSQGRRLRVHPLTLDSGRYRLDVVAFAGAITERARMLILCSPHNPTGRVWTREELTALASVCREHGLFVVSDEVHADLVLAGHTHTPFGSLAAALSERSITCVSPNKTFNTSGLPQATLVIPDEEVRARLARRFDAAQTTLDTTFSRIAMIAAYRDGAPWLDALLDYLAGNFALLREACTRIGRIQLIEPQGTYLAWLDARALGIPSMRLRDLLAQRARVGLYEGTAFGPEGEGFLRMNIACPRARLAEALVRIEETIDSIAHEASR